MNRVFSSNFAVHIEDLIQQKHRLGYPYDESERILYNFDQFCLKFFPLERTLTQQLGLAWAIRRESEGVNTFRNRMMPVRELARHLNRLGIEAYIIPTNITKKAARYMPHIYTMEQLRKFFDILDLIPQRRTFLSGIL